MDYQYYQLDQQRENFTEVALNQKNIIIFLNSDENNSKVNDFLLNVMKAVKVDFSEACNLISVNKDSLISFKNILQTERSLKILIFGVSPSQLDLKINFPSYHCFQFLHHQIIQVEKVMLIQDDKNRKLKLWNELKFMFKIE